MAKARFTHSLFERLKAWAELIGKRGDVEVVSALKVGAESDNELPEGFGADAVAFAKQCEALSFSYKFKAAAECSAFLYLYLDGDQQDAFMELDGEEVDPSSMYMLDADAEGTGHAAWYILGKKPLIVWDVESLCRFKSLDEYLTEGAKRGFSYNPCWQEKGAEVPLAAVSVPKSTPVADLKKALIARGTSDAMASDLIKWLGQAVHLLLPARGA